MADSVIELYGKRVMLLEESIKKKVLPDPDTADLWIVNHNDPKLVKKFLTLMMRSDKIEVFLKPIFLQKDFKKAYHSYYDTLKHLSDGFIKGLNFLEKVAHIDTINVFIEKMRITYNYDDKISDDFYAQKILYYYYTRMKSIVPILDRTSLSGYSYPRIEAFFKNKSEIYSRSRMILRESYLVGLLSRSYVDTSHLCKSCSSGFLNYREICPKCNGHDLKARDLIHHFRCAYVGIEKDYILKDKHVCPKCSSELKNLGVDYDKPGKIFICKDKKCNHEFQDAPIGVHCVDCKTEQFPEELIVKKIYSYELTTLGYEQVFEQ